MHLSGAGAQGIIYTLRWISLCIVAGYLLPFTGDWQQVTSNYKKDDYTFLSGAEYNYKVPGQTGMGAFIAIIKK